jgi:hypothetical protein
MDESPFHIKKENRDSAEPRHLHRNGQTPDYTHASLLLSQRENLDNYQRESYYPSLSKSSDIAHIHKDMPRNRGARQKMDLAVQNLN